MRRSFVVLVAFGAFISACASGTSSLAPGGEDDAGGPDGTTGTLDATIESGGRPTPEAGSQGRDSASDDATLQDASLEDAEPDDAGGGDAASDDSATGIGDSSIADTGTADTSSPTDAGAADSASADSAVLDAGPTDAAPADAAPCAPADAGGYAATCSSCAIVGNTLSCECKNDSQQNTPTSLNLCGCVAPIDIENNNGVLSCCGSPEGSYTGTCSNCNTTGNTLTCSCNNDSQQPTDASLNLCTCTSTTVISNQNGVLACP